jgi:hypothetical protein
MQTELCWTRWHDALAEPKARKVLMASTPPCWQKGDEEGVGMHPPQRHVQEISCRGAEASTWRTPGCSHCEHCEPVRHAILPPFWQKGAKKGWVSIPQRRVQRRSRPWTRSRSSKDLGSTSQIWVRCGLKNVEPVKEGSHGNPHGWHELHWRFSLTTHVRLDPVSKQRLE